MWSSPRPMERRPCRYCPAGRYTATASLSGFKQAVVTDLRLDAAGKGTLALVLVPGWYTESVVVSADVSRLQPGRRRDRPGVRRPHAGDDADGHARLPAVRVSGAGRGAAGAGSRLSSEGNAASTSPARAKPRTTSCSTASTTTISSSTASSSTPSLDAIQEVIAGPEHLRRRVRPQRRRPGQRRREVGQQRYCTASLFEYFRHESLDARGSLLIRLTRTSRGCRRNQFGGTLGGPIGRMAAASTSRRRGRLRRARRKRAGATCRRRPSGPAIFRRGRDTDRSVHGRPFPGNLIPQDRASDPTGTRVAGAVSGSQPLRRAATSRRRRWDRGTASSAAIKTDHALLARHPLIRLRYATAARTATCRSRTARATCPASASASMDDGRHAARRPRCRGLSAHVFNELRVGFNALHRDNAPQSAAAISSPRSASRGPCCRASIRGILRSSVPGYETLGDDPNLPVVRRTSTLHLSDSLAIDRGRHHVEAGGECGTTGPTATTTCSRAARQASPARSPATRSAICCSASRPSRCSPPTTTARRCARWSVNLFVQDDWRVRGRLTLNAGLRYEFNAPPVDADDRMAGVRPGDHAAASQVGRTACRAPASTRTATTSRRAVGQLGSYRPRHAGAARRLRHLLRQRHADRELGALLQPALFRSAGCSHRSGAAASFGSVSARSRVRAARVGEHARACVPTRHLRRRGASGSRDGCMVWTSRHATSVRAAVTRAAAQCEPAAAWAGPHRRSASDTPATETSSSSSRPRRRTTTRCNCRPSGSARTGLSFRAAYTWASRWTTRRRSCPAAATTIRRRTPRHPEAERGLSDFDVRHRLSIAAVWPIPPARWAWTQHWQVSAIFAAQSGRPFTPRVSVDNSNTGNNGGSFGYDRPNEVTPATPDAVMYEGRAFVMAPAYSFGDAGRNILIGPASASLDLAIGRTFSLGGDRRVELRAEIYNALNRANLSLPESFIDRPTFGQSVSADAPRQIQIVGRVNF